MVVDASTSTSTSSPLELLIAACREGDATQTRELLLQHDGAIFVDAVGADSDTPLIAASRYGHRWLVRHLLELGANVNASTANGWTSLHAAAENDHKDVAAELLAYRACVNATNVNGSTALHIAAHNGHIDMVVELLERGASVDAADADGSTALHFAAGNGYKDVVVELLVLGASVDAADADGSTALHIAAGIGHKDVVVELLERGASVDVADADGWTALHVAAGIGHKDVVVDLLKRRASVDAADVNGSTALHVAAQNGHKDVVVELLKRRASVDAATADGWTVLHFAAQNGHKDVVVELLKRGASVGAANAEGLTALHVAARNGHKDVVVELLERGASVDAANAEGMTALHFAAQNGHKDVVVELLERGASVDAATALGSTALHVAARIGHKDVVVELLKRGASVDAADAEGLTALYVAAGIGHKDVVVELLERGASVDAADADGWTVLHVAAHRGHLTIVISLCGPPTSSSSGDRSSLHTRSSDDSEHERGAGAIFSECRDGFSNIVTSQLSNAKKLGIADAQANTPLLTAAKSGHFEVVKHFINEGADVSARAADGETVLISAARWRNLSVVTFLLDRGLLTPEHSTEEQESLLPATLQTLQDYESQTHEFRQMWMRVVNRLLSVYDRLAETPSSSRESIFLFSMAVFHLVRLKMACSGTSVFARLVASQTIASRFRDFHTELTFLKQTLDPASLVSPRLDWESECKVDELALLTHFRETIDGDLPADTGLATEENRKEAATLLQHKVRAEGNKCSPELLDLLELSLSKVRNASTEPLPLIPTWFISPNDIDADQGFSASKDVAPMVVVRGEWSSSSVMVSEHRMPRDTFVEAVEACFRLSHPNVAKVFGASHLQSPFKAVLENALSMSLREYLSREANKHLIWQKLHEVSLGLKYLVERRVIVNNLRCDDIWVGTDGIAKINVLSCVAVQNTTTEDAKWQAPEVTRGETPTTASNVYSLGMCMIEAITGKTSWKDRENRVFTASTAQLGWRPQLPEGMTSAQRDLLERMWLVDPSKRPTLLMVIQQLAREQTSKRSSHGKTKTGKIQPYDIQRFEFSGLESTIPGFLDKLEWKCEYYSESKEAVQHILRRARDVYELLQTQHRLHNDVIVTSYCEVLVSLNRFLRNANHEKSVLLRAKSQKVALQSNVFHRKLDDLLELLAPATVNPVHVWTQQPTTPEVDIETGSSEEECNTSHNSQRDSNALAATTTKQEAVRIELFESERPNMRFKAISALTTPEHTPSLPSRRIDVHDLKYDSGSVIGTGAFGEVYKAAWLGTPVVIKFMGYEADGDAYRDKLFFHELRVWEPLNHPHVVKLYGACEVGKRFFACEFMGNGTLAEYVKREGNETKTWHLLYQVALGLQYLHDLNILHNDLKCDNVLIGTDGDAKIIDFGLSSILKSAEVQIDKKNQGAQQWKSPEYIRGDRLTLASDIYSFGMLILEATTGDSPWGGLTDAAVRFQLKTGNLPQQPKCLSGSQWNLVKMMCATNPSQRVQISSVVDKLHEFSQQ